MTDRAGAAVRAGAVVLALAYAVRAATGVPAGLAYARGAAAAADGDYAAALPDLRKAEIGGNRYEALWLAGQVRLGMWDEAGPERADPALLRAALEDGREAARLSPASGWPWALMAGAAWRAERAAAGGREFSLDWLSGRPWSRVGRDGRRAVAWTREASAREPSTPAYRDQEAQILLDLGLEEEGLRAVRAAAGVQPVFGLHDLGPAGEREGVRLAFEEASRAALGTTPLLPRERHLLSLALLNERLGRTERALADLQEAVREPAPRVQQAEGAFHLGRILLQAGRVDEARPWLERAAQVAVFRPAVGSLLAQDAERRGDLEGALLRLQEVRRLRPRDLEPLLEFARVARRAGRISQAVEALSWATLNHPRDLRARTALVETLASAGRVREARAALQDLKRAGAPASEVERLEELCAPAATSP